MMADPWTPSYERWRHGGWYVTNVRYPSGAVGCVSNKYEDKRWRIVCSASDVTFPSRDAAARAEKALADEQCRIARRCATCDHYEEQHYIGGEPWCTGCGCVCGEKGGFR